MKAVVSLAVLGLIPLLGAEAQFATVSAGLLVSKRVPDPIAELHAETPPVHDTRGWITLSWTDESARPTVITSVEHALLHITGASTGLGVGVLWLEPDESGAGPRDVQERMLDGRDDRRPGALV